jgi:hypothetical protein
VIRRIRPRAALVPRTNLRFTGGAAQFEAIAFYILLRSPGIFLQEHAPVRRPRTGFWSRLRVGQICRAPSPAYPAQQRTAMNRLDQQELRKESFRFRNHTARSHKQRFQHEVEFRVGFQIVTWLIKNGKDQRRIQAATDVFRTSAALSGDRGIF